MLYDLRTPDRRVSRPRSNNHGNGGNVSCGRNMDAPRRIMLPRLRFRLGLTSKLFLVLLGAILLAALATSVSVRLGFIMRVTGRLHVPAFERLRSKRLEGYERQGRWEFLRQDPSAWLNALRDAAVISPDPFMPIPRPNPDRVPVPRLMLLDSRRRVLIGPSQVEANTPMRPMVANGQVVGWLAGFASPVASGGERVAKRVE